MTKIVIRSDDVDKLLEILVNNSIDFERKELGQGHGTEINIKGDMKK
jgi:hypothetical protein